MKTAEIVRANNRQPVPLETRQAIIADALERMETETLEQIANDHAISKSTLNQWLMGLGEEYTDKRNAVIDHQLTDAQAQFEQDRRAMLNATDAFTLARARDCHAVSKSQMTFAQWYAERRDKRYSPKADAAPVSAPVFMITFAQPESVVYDVQSLPVKP